MYENFTDLQIVSEVGRDAIKFCCVAPSSEYSIQGKIDDVYVCTCAQHEQKRIIMPTVSAGSEEAGWLAWRDSGDGWETDP